MLVKVVLTTRKPHWASFLYVAAMFTNDLMFSMALGTDIQTIALKLSIMGGVSFAFFWGLNEFESSPLYWLVLVAGIPAMLFLT